MEITYHWTGDYLIPDLKLSDTTEYHKHLAEIDEESNEMMDRLVERIAKGEGVTEQLKSDDSSSKVIKGDGMKCSRP